jgi:predicted metal-dependent enzyme (double-stranded beta helix superfamily)
MKNLTYFIMSVLLATLALGLGVNTAMADDLAKVMPDDVKVLVDNDRVRVLDVTHKPGVKEPMHSHPAYVSVNLSDTKVKVTTPDGKTVEKVRKAGEVSWSEATTHAIETVGTAGSHTIVIELKK